MKLTKFSDIFKLYSELLFKDYCLYLFDVLIKKKIKYFNPSAIQETNQADD